MHERGTYGSNGHSHGFPQQWSPPTVGSSPDATRSTLADALFTGVFTLIGGYFGRGATPDDPNKGAIIGAATGYFFKLIMDQTSELKRMNNNLAQMR